VKILHLLNVITAYKPTPFAKGVKLATKVEHDRIEKHPFVDNLIAGKLTDAQYACYLLNLIPIYESIERHLNLCGDLLRSNIMRSDLLKYQKSLGPLGDMYFYHEWLENINSANKLTTISNFYIRWLGDLYGGQILAKNIKFNQHLKFKNVRHSIRQARDLIELNAKNQDTEFVSLIKKAYSFNYDLVDNLYNHVC
jgi:heme oxygenase